MADVVYRGTAGEAAAMVREAVAAMTGGPDPHGVGRALKLRMGVALLSCVQTDFITKSRGGVGRDGIKWEPLKPETVARRRLGKADKRAVKGKSAKDRFAYLAARDVEILRDTGELFRSFEPGVEDRPSNADGQVFDLLADSVTVGTSKKPWHHKGIPGRLPARPFWPPDGSLPPAWWRAVNEAAVTGVVRAVEAVLTRG